jgi:hypothetical protein
VATYEELRNALQHIADVYRDANAWQRAMSPQDIGDINGYLNAQAHPQSAVGTGAGAGGHTAGVTGWRDPQTGKVYEYNPTSTGKMPQVPDTLIGALRDRFPGLFGPKGELTSPPPGQALPLPGIPARGAPPPGQPLPTGEQQSGRAADAVKKLQEELNSRYTKLSGAEEQLSEVLLNAHATTADGQQKLNDIQQKIVEAVNNTALSLETPAGEQAFLKFLRTQVAAIGDVMQSGTLRADDQTKAIQALSNLYAVDQGNSVAPTSPAGQPGQQPPAPGESSPPPATPAATPPGASDPGLGPQQPMPDPTLSDLGLGGMGGPLGADPLSSLSSTLPAALGAIPSAGGLGSTPLDSLGGLAGAAAPLAGLASQLGEQARHDNNNDTKDTSGAKTDPKADSTTGIGDTKDKGQQGNTGQLPPPPGAPPNAAPGAGAPPAGPGPAPVPPTSVPLPDGATANARTPALAQAVKAYLGGTPVDAAYRQAGIELPPPGTPVTNPVDPSQLSCGNIGMFKDHYVVALSSVKALQDGQVVALASVTSGTDFLGWMDPSALGTTGPAPPPAAAAAPSGDPALTTPQTPPAAATG